MVNRNMIGTNKKHLNLHVEEGIDWFLFTINFIVEDSKTALIFIEFSKFFFSFEFIFILLRSSDHYKDNLLQKIFSVLLIKGKYC